MVTGSERSLTLKPYPQEWAETIDASALGEVRCTLADSIGRVWFGGTAGVARYADGRLEVVPGAPQEVTALCEGDDGVYALGGNGLARWNEQAGWQTVVGAPAGIQAGAAGRSGLAVATGKALHVLKEGAWQEHAFPEPAQVRGVALGAASTVWLATNAGLWRWDGKWMVLGADRLLSADVRAVLADKLGHAWAGTAAGLDLVAGDGWVEHVRGQDGLCYEDITALARSPEVTWIGTSCGLIRLQGATWDYYAGRRWLPDNRVVAVATTADATYAVTPSGVGRIYTRMMTLEQKAAYFEERIQKRHYRLAYVADCHLPEPGNTDKFIHEASDNDGLWTALYVVAESYRWAATKDPQARTLASKSLQAMLDLERKCSLPGYVARALVRKDEPNTHKSGGEWHDTADGLYEWKGDTSSDEIDGHLYAYSVYFDLVADDEEKRQIAQTVEHFMDYILDNGYYLIDVDGKPTRWGVWAPERLNADPRWQQERGLNSMEILSHLLAAHHITGKARYLEAYHDLVRNHHYALNTVHQKIMEVGEVNHSDDELAWCAYYPLLAYERDPELRAIYLFSFEQSWKVERPEHCPWYNFVYAALTGKPCDLEESVKNMRDQPMELITWRMTNSQRADLPLDPNNGRFQEPQALVAIPADERRVMRWNANPYRLDGGDDGRSEDDGAAFLISYWMGRYYGFIKE